MSSYEVVRVCPEINKLINNLKSATKNSKAHSHTYILTYIHTKYACEVWPKNIANVAIYYVEKSKRICYRAILPKRRTYRTENSYLYIAVTFEYVTSAFNIIYVDKNNFEHKIDYV